MKRRSIYGISDQSPLSDEQLEQALGQLVQNLPTAYDMKGTRLVLLLGAGHKKLWSIVLDALRPLVPADSFSRTEAKVARFTAGHGTVLFFNDEAVTKQYMNENPLYAGNFPGWALQQNAMLQLAVWAWLAEQGLGASLQHYNPLIDDAVRDAFALPASWQLIAQMPFGAPTEDPGEKDYLPLEERLRVFTQPV